MALFSPSPPHFNVSPACSHHISSGQSSGSLRQGSHPNPSLPPCPSPVRGGNAELSAPDRHNWFIATGLVRQNHYRPHFLHTLFSGIFVWSGKFGVEKRTKTRCRKMYFVLYPIEIEHITFKVSFSLLKYSYLGFSYTKK